MKRYLLYICAAALLGSCSESSDGIPGEPSQENKVRFAANIPAKEDDWSQAATRGTAIGSDNIAGFSAFCFHTDRQLWSEVSGTALPNKMFDVDVKRVGNTNEWSYDPPVEWMGGDGSYFTFFGYSPRATGTYDGATNPSGNNIELTTTASTPGMPLLNYTTVSDVTQQADLLVAKPVYNTRPVERVPMQFAHALAQVRFKAYSEQANVIPTSIAIRGIQYKGSIAADGSAIVWAADTQTTDFALEGNFPAVSTDQTKMTDLSAGDRAFLLLPQDLTGNTTAKIEISAMVSGTEVASTPYTIVQNWQAGKSYTYTIKLGGNPTTEIVITGVTITDWQVDSEENMTTTPETPKNPINTPGSDDYVQIGDLYWAKGNLVATSSTAGGANGCKVGNQYDGGLYFQFGSLIGWKGGALANGGTGVGYNPYTTNGTYWNGAGSVTWSNDAMVWPTSMDGNRPDVWQGNTNVGTEADAFKTWFFNFNGTSGGVNYSSAHSDIRGYTHPTLGAFKSGGMASLGVGDACTYYLGDKWRLPTAAEYKTLFDEVANGTAWGSVPNWSWTTTPYNGAQGSTLYFPASGRRNYSNGSFYGVITYGFGWSSSVYNATSGYDLYFDSGRLYPQNGLSRSYGFPVRCVSENP